MGTRSSFWTNSPSTGKNAYPGSIVAFLQQILFSLFASSFLIPPMKKRQSGFDLPERRVYLNTYTKPEITSMVKNRTRPEVKYAQIGFRSVMCMSKSARKSTGLD